MQAVSYNQYLLKKQQLTMASDSLPNSFDVIVVGTGLEESILAAAASRNGHSVLHLDTLDYYGGDWAAFNFQGLQEWIQRQSLEDQVAFDVRELQEKFVQADGERVVLLKSKTKTVSGLKEEWHCPDKEEEKEVSEEAGDTLAEQRVPTDDETNEPANEPHEIDQGDGEKPKSPPQVPRAELQAPKWTKQAILDSSRRFNIDLVPKLLFSRGSMVDLLITSNISR